MSPNKVRRHNTRYADLHMSGKKCTEGARMLGVCRAPSTQNIRSGSRASRPQGTSHDMSASSSTSERWHMNVRAHSPRYVYFDRGPAFGYDTDGLRSNYRRCGDIRCDCESPKKNRQEAVQENNRCKAQFVYACERKRICYAPEGAGLWRAESKVYAGYGQGYGYDGVITRERASSVRTIVQGRDQGIPISTGHARPREGEGRDETGQDKTRRV